MILRLSQEEMANPHQALESIFECYHLLELTELISTVQDHLFNRSYPHEPDSDAHDDTLFLFEQVEKLIQASFMVQYQPQNEQNDLYRN